MATGLGCKLIPTSLRFARLFPIKGVLVAEPAVGEPEPKHDVAISFLVKNEPIARELTVRLEGALDVFYFPRKQEELAGTDGLESMREPFMDSRVAVVIFDDPWGATPWTRVEETAIKERCLDQGWDGLMFVQVSKTATLPKWLPRTNVRFSLEDYGIDGLAGAVKAQVQRLGGKIQRPDALARAKRVKADQDYLRDREAMMRDTQWITGTVLPGVRKTLQEVIRLTQDVNAQSQLSIQSRASNQQAVIRANQVSLSMDWKQPIGNLVADYRGDECHLRAAEYRGNVLLPGENAWYIEPPRLLRVCPGS
jgi:hypothetical protein